MTPRKTILTVEAAESGLRIDRLLIRRLPEMNRAKIRALFDAERLRLNGARPPGPSAELAAGDQVELLFPDGAQADLSAYVLLDDPLLLVAYKPAGLPLPREILEPREPGHDRRVPPPRAVLKVPDAASGVVVAARSAPAWHQLGRQLSGTSGRRSFTVLVDRPVRRSRGPLEGTDGWMYRVLQRFHDHALLQLAPPRALDADARNAVSRAGMAVVSLPDSDPPRLALHAAGVVFGHPVSHRRLRFNPRLPAPFKDFLQQLQPATTLAANVPTGPPRDHHGPATKDGPEPALRSPRDLLQRKPVRRS